MSRAFYRACHALPRISALAIAAVLAGCKAVEVPKLPGVTPYRMEIQQGNYISQDMVAQLKPGLTREQVRFILGTPLVTDIFHANRWDFVFFRERPNGKREQRNLSVIFEDNKLARVIGDLLLNEPTAAKPPAKPAAEAKSAAEAKPAAEAPKPAAEIAKPAATGQNWRAASDEPPVKPVSKPEPKSEAVAAPKEEEKKPAAEEPKERGFFGRLLERIVPAQAAKAKPAPKSAAEEKPAAEAPKPAPPQEETKPADEKERGFFGRMLEKIGL